MEYDTSKVDPAKAHASSFHHQDLLNDSPGKIKTTVEGSKRRSQSVSMTFGTTVTNSYTISNKVGLKAKIPSFADVRDQVVSVIIT